MNEALTKAATAASEALGMSVQVTPGMRHRGLATPVPFAKCIIWRDAASHYGNARPLEEPFDAETARMLSYLEGLETGARIANERHRPLVEAARRLNLHHLDPRSTDQRGALIAIRAALKELEG